MLKFPLNKTKCINAILLKLDDIVRATFIDN